MSRENKPSKNEEEYASRHDAELIETAREVKAKLRAEAERKTHIMKCPRDGYDLKHTTRLGVTVEHCHHCGGLWLDAGEIEQVIKHREPGLLRRVFTDVVSGIRDAKSKP